jgi:hypothetical protein
MRFQMPAFSPGSLMPVALFAAGALSVLGYGYITRHHGDRATSAAQVARQLAASVPGEGEPTRRLVARGDDAGLPMGSQSADADSSGAEASGSSGVADDAAAPIANGALASGASPPQGKTELVATPENVSVWIAQATGSDAARRATAIEALGSAPKSDAVPVLAQVLDTADDADRPRALRSLRTLAQREGDGDDRIRSVVRKIAFHTDDEATAQSAQATLDDIERDLSHAESRKR